MSIIDNNQYVPLSPKTPVEKKQKVNRLIAIIRKAPGYQSGQTPKLNERAKPLIDSSPKKGTISGVDVEVTPQGIRVSGKHLGSGYTSNVSEVVRFDKESGQIKVLAKLESRNQSVLKRSVKILENLKIFGLTETDLTYLGLPLRVDYGENGRIKSLLLSLQGQDLSEVSSGSVPLYFYSKELASAAKGLAHLHKAGFVHSDIKADNILSSIDDKPAQLADFGFTRRATIEKTKIGGASRFFAPETYATIDEMKANLGMVDSKSDIYTWGLMMRNLMIEKILPEFIPFSGSEFDRLEYRNIQPNDKALYGRVYYLKEKDQFYAFAKDEEYSKIFDRILSESRLSEEQKRALTDFMDYALSCTHIDPQARPSADDIAEFLTDFAKRTETITNGTKLNFGLDTSSSDSDLSNDDSYSDDDSDEDGYSLF